jgi:radical SAM protein
MKIPRVDYDQTPFLIIWETTQACDLVCRHCRLAAQPERDPCELSTEEGESVLRQAKEMGTPIFILSGGDPLKRRDLHHLIRYGADLGLRMATIPAATPTLTEAAVSELKKAGLSQMALSLDFPTAELHDGFRGVPGAWAKTMEAIGWAKKHDMPLQINTTICRDALPHLDRMIDLVRGLPIVFWEVFFLVPMGRGSELGGLTADECEAVFAKLYRLQKEVSFLVKVTEAPHYRRFVAEQERLEGEMTNRHPGALPSQLVRTEGPGHTIGLAPRGVNAGKGFLFISHLGEVFPSGFLPVSAGNIRHTPLATLYRETELFLKLRDPDRLVGICGRCEYRAICGGSRSRAFALTGNLLASDPWCAYRPAELKSI